MRKKIPSIIFIYNTFNKTYFRYFHGHYVKYAEEVPYKNIIIIQNFIDEQFHKLDYSLSKYEKYLLWVFSKYDKLPINVANSHIDEYLKIKEKNNEFKPFSNIIEKYIREENIKSLGEYILPQGNFYPKIIQHYMRDKNFPFEFILFMKIFDRVNGKQRKMLKSIFREELYNLEEKEATIKNNRHFFTEELRKINNVFGG